MNYDVFLQLQNGELCRAEDESEQAFMEKTLQAAYADNGEDFSGRIFNALSPKFHSCSAEDCSLTASFVAEDWMLNPQDTLHGGVLSTVFDMTMCNLARYLKKVRGVATVQLSIQFLRAIKRGETFTITAIADHVGRRSTMIRAEARVEGSPKLTATASGVFL